MKKYTFKNKDVFQFVLYRNNDIVCVRDFGVSGYNRRNKYNNDNNLELMKHLGNDTDSSTSLGIIPAYIKSVSEDNLWKKFNPYSTVRVHNDDANNDETNFMVEVNKLPTKKIKKDEYVILDDKKFIENVGRIGFNGNKYPRRIRDFLDIVPIVNEVISVTRDYLTNTEYR